MGTVQDNNNTKCHNINRSQSMGTVSTTKLTHKQESTAGDSVTDSTRLTHKQKSKHGDSVDH